MTVACQMMLIQAHVSFPWYPCQRGAYSSSLRRSCEVSKPGPSSEESRQSGRDRLWERLDLGHPGSHIVMESACQLERADVVGRVDEYGRGTPLTQPVGNRVEPVLPSRDCTCHVVPADVADDGIGREGP